MSATVLLRVHRVRSQQRGGCIFTGRVLKGDGQVADATGYYVVRMTPSVLNGTAVQPGQHWAVTGTARDCARVVNGYRLRERQIDATAAQLRAVSGEQIIRFIAESPEFAGIGMVKARKLWDRFGDTLYALLDTGDVAALSTVLPMTSAQTLVDAWVRHGCARTLQWLQQHDIDASIARKLLAFHGDAARAKLEEDPYRLLSFCASWKQVDALAHRVFGIADGDARRLQAAVEEALYRLFSEGHTVATQAMVVTRLQPLLADGHGTTWRQRVADALAHGITNGSYVVDAQGLLHPTGPYLMECQVAQAIVGRLQREVPLLPTARVNAVLAAFEATQQVLLTHEQRTAIAIAVKAPLALITGGAGVGKTTVLHALYRVYDAAGLQIVQLALAGRAAMRMREATGRPASTIASFLTTRAGSDLPAALVVVVDETSMVDLISMHKLCTMLPDTARLLLVGDPVQLMPVGPGLVLHALVDSVAIPKTELTIVKRHGGAIAAAARAIRNGCWPSLPLDTTQPIAFVPCRDADIPAQMVALYAQDHRRTQILCCRQHHADGTVSLNAACQQQFAADAPALQTWDDERQQTVSTGLRLGDPVLCTRNLWEMGLQNGSLGHLVELEPVPRWLNDDDDQPTGLLIGWAQWDDGQRRPIFASMLDDLVLGYAITVHKAQGSQWPRVLVAVTGNRTLDRALLYTAVTRAQQQVILVGDADAARQAVEQLPRSLSRHVALGPLITALLRQTS